MDKYTPMFSLTDIKIYVSDYLPEGKYMRGADGRSVVVSRQDYAKIIKHMEDKNGPRN